MATLHNYYQPQTKKESKVNRVDRVNTVKTQNEITIFFKKKIRMIMKYSLFVVNKSKFLTVLLISN